jgi:hypothetical protein
LNAARTEVERSNDNLTKRRLIPEFGYNGKFIERTKHPLTGLGTEDCFDQGLHGILFADGSVFKEDITMGVLSPSTAISGPNIQDPSPRSAPEVHDSLSHGEFNGEISGWQEVPLHDSPEPNDQTD